MPLRLVSGRAAAAQPIVLLFQHNSLSFAPFPPLDRPINTRPLDGFQWLPSNERQPQSFGISIIRISIFRYFGFRYSNNTCSGTHRTLLSQKATVLTTTSPPSFPLFPCHSSSPNLSSPNLRAPHPPSPPGSPPASLLPPPLIYTLYRLRLTPSKSNVSGPFGGFRR